jgi:hypothetical protein
MRHLLKLSFALFFFSSVRSQQPAVTIRFAESYQYDLAQHIYSVFYTRKPPYKAHFRIRRSEKKAIKREVQALHINNIAVDTGNTKIILLEDAGDAIRVMPTLLTTVTFQLQGKKIVIQIGEGFSRFKPNDQINPYSVRQFIQVVRRIIDNKPPIKSAPQSDIHYQ